MTQYLLIESRDPYESGDADFIPTLATELHRKGETVTIFLVQNGVLPARAEATRTQLQQAIAAGVTILADSFSLSERGIAVGDITADIKPALLEVVADALADGAKTIWH